MIQKGVCSKAGVFCLLLIVGLIIYAPSFSVPLQLDDTVIVKENYVIRSLDLGRIFQFDPSRFITHLSFALNYSIHQTDVFGYHLVNFLLHVLNAYLVFLFLNRLLLFHSEEDNRVWAVLGSLIFLCHPLQTSAVTYVVQRSVLIAIACYLGALLLYIRLRISFKMKEYVLLWVVVVLGMFSKPIIFTLPITAFLVELIFLRSCSLKQKPILWVPFGCVLLMVPLLVLGYFTNVWGQSFGIKDLSLALQISYDTPRSHYLYTQFFVWVRYFQLLCLPLQQSVYHALELAKSFTEPRVFGSFVFHIALMTSAILLIRRSLIFFFTVFWFYVLMIPEGSIFSLPDVMFEHRLYIVIVPFSVFFVFLLRSFKLNRSVIFSGTAILIFGLGFLTFQRNMLWNNPEALLVESTKRYPASEKPLNHLGVYYEQREELSKAEDMFKKAISFNETYTPAVLNLGRVYAQQEDWPRAKQHFDRALRMSPGSYDILVNLGDYYFRTNSAKNAIAHYQRALKLKPNQAYPLFKIGEIYQLSGRPEPAVPFYLKSLQANPLYEAAQYSLGNAYLEQRKFKQAIATYQKVLQKNPSYGDAYNTMGIAYVRINEYRQAESAFLKALELNPDSRILYQNLAQLYDKQGDKERAEIYQNMADQRMADPKNGK